MYRRFLIVAEGRGDAAALRRALGDIEVIWTDGLGLTAAKLAYIAKAATVRDVVVCTDPDHAGEMIRARLNRHIPGLLHVYLPRQAARNRRGRGVGWEYASPAAVRAAFALLRPAQADALASASGLPVSAPDSVSLQAADLAELGLSGCPAARERRRTAGRNLGLGECNAKQFLRRANSLHITR
ncbi:MAG: DUF4093 domain-containing protein, partial [Gracilibacteraceae bacterium]|nr:DUF4093 domain-containing protein [Gracilibacteraceae bacterium]